MIALSPTVVTVFMLSVWAASQMFAGPLCAAERRRAVQQRASVVVATAGVGVAIVDSSMLSTLDLSLAARRGRFSGGVRLPLQLHLVDMDPSRADRYTGVRDRDWDERAEWLRLLDHAAWRWRGKDGRRVSVRVQPIAGATLGHGSIVHRYHGALRPDNFKAGARARWDARWFGGDVFTDDVTSGGLVAGRLFMRPWGEQRSGLARTFTIGATAAWDRSAPVRSIRDHRGRRTFSAQGLLQAHRGHVLVAGVDLSTELMRSNLWSLVPYLDANFSRLHRADGLAAHVGARLALWPASERRQLTARYEWRVFDGAALPGYFDTLHEVEQSRFLGPGAARTKVAALSDLGVGARAGHLLELTGRLGAAQWAATLELYDRVGLDTAALWLDVPSSRRGRLRLMVARRRFSGLANVFDAGEWTAALSGRAVVARPIELFVSLQSAWHVHQPGTAELRPTFDALAGISLSRLL